MSSNMEGGLKKKKLYTLSKHRAVVSVFTAGGNSKDKWNGSGSTSTSALMTFGMSSNSTVKTYPLEGRESSVSSTPMAKKKVALPNLVLEQFDPCKKIWHPVKMAEALHLHRGRLGARSASGWWGPPNLRQLIGYQHACTSRTGLSMGSLIKGLEQTVVLDTYLLQV